MAPKNPDLPARDASAVFEMEPHVYFNLSQDKKLLARGFDSLVRQIESTIKATTCKENNGTPVLVCQESIPVNQEKHFVPWSTDCLYVHATPVLPNSGLLVVVIRPPPNWGWYEKGGDGQLVLGDNRRPKLKRLEVLLRLTDLYVLGFQSANLWRPFKDVSLSGVISDTDIKQYVKPLSFDSTYGAQGMCVNFTKLKIGQAPTFKTYKVLSNNMCYSDSDTMKALATISVTISEGTRIRHFGRRVVNSFATGNTEVVDEDPDDPDSDRIHRWGHDSDGVKQALVLDGLDPADAERERDKRHQILRELGVIKN